MPIVFACAASHAPGMTAWTEAAPKEQADNFLGNYRRLGERLAAAKPDVIVALTVEHWANFFLNSMPTFCIGRAPHYDGPIEDPQWLGIEKVRIPGNAELSERVIRATMQEADVAYAEEWKFDHGLMVPLHFLTPRYDLPVIPVNINCQGPPLTPLTRAWAFGTALRQACDKVPERIALVGTGGISHWPASPDSGKINEAFDREFVDRWCRNDQAALLSYSDAETYREAGQGGFEIRTFIAVAAAARGAGEIRFYQPIPIFSVGCTVGVMAIA